MPLLSVEGLRVSLASREGLLPIIRGVDFTIARGEVLGVAGESGSGKSMSMLALLGLLPRYARREGVAEFDGRDLLALNQRQLRHVRGQEVGFVFQDNGSSLHPMLTVGRQLTEHMRRSQALRRRDALTRAAELLARVRIPDSRRALERYPHEFSGGMRQRIAIAMALACGPRLLIADEPTTALDVTVQAGILRLLRELARDEGLAVILITHDLGVLAAAADRIAVMYAGRIVEAGTIAQVLERTRHPYARALLDSQPDHRLGYGTRRGIGGSPPVAGRLPGGCAFHPRCAFARPECAADEPSLTAAAEPGHRFACPVDPLRDPIRSSAAS